MHDSFLQLYLHTWRSACASHCIIPFVILDGASTCNPDLIESGLCLSKIFRSIRPRFAGVPGKESLKSSSFSGVLAWLLIFLSVSRCISMHFLQTFPLRRILWLSFIFVFPLFTIAAIFRLLTHSAIWLYLDFIPFPDHLLFILIFKSIPHISLPYIFGFWINDFNRWGEENPADLAGSLPALAWSSPPGAPCGREHARARRSAVRKVVESRRKSRFFDFSVSFVKNLAKWTKPHHGEVSNIPLQKSNCQNIVLDL